jgi:16S rRNA (uracil1498-N3)-methyltransferase
MHIFFEPSIQPDIITLSAEESQHCARVLRLRPGQEVGIADGKGTFAMASLLEVHAKGTTASILNRQNTPARPYRLHMAVAPTKNIDRFEWFLEKATECGIEEITPIICAQSERTVVKSDRLQKILLAAMKQSQRAWLPMLHETVKCKDFIKQIDGSQLACMAHCAEGEKQAFSKLYQPGSDILIMIGPEGDFSTEEIQQATQQGIKSITLGESRLRTETAALVACMGFNFMNGELGNW